VKRRGGQPLNILITLCRASAGKTLKGVRNNEQPVEYSFYESFVRTARESPDAAPLKNI
jgi:hypothetical protein